jgi:hypothetical protein
MDISPLVERAEQQYGLLSARQLEEAGFSSRMISTRVNAGFLRRRGRGVLQLAGARPTWEQDVLAAVLEAEPLAAASHRAAARLWGFRTVDDEVEVSIRYPRDVSPDLATVHRSRDLDEADITVVDSIPTTTPERTICDLGLIFAETEVARILRHAIVADLVVPRDLWRMRQRTSKQGRNGTGVLERILETLPEEFDGVESGLELQFLELCQRANIARPAVQLPVRISGSAFRLDFAWTSERVFVEIDGAAFHSTPEQLASDRRRQNLLVLAGWTPLRFSSTDLSKQPVRSIALLRQTLDL